MEHVHHQHQLGTASTSSTSSSKGTKKERAAQKLIPQLEAANAQIKQALEESSQASFGKPEQKALKSLLRSLISFTDTMTAPVSRSTGIAKSVKKLANHHKDDKVKKWANSYFETEMKESSI